MSDYELIEVYYRLEDGKNVRYVDVFDKERGIFYTRKVIEGRY